MPHEPAVSVVLPVFNGAETIERAVRSILDQTFRDIELIVVDDGSTDATVRIVTEIQDHRLRVLRCEHRHVASAANTGTVAARAPIIARMDADDFSHATRFDKQIELLQRRDLDAVGCRIRIVDESRQLAKSMQRYARWINDETLGSTEISALRFVELPLVNPTILARRRYFELGFRSGDFPEDYDLMLRAAATDMRFGKVDEILFDWIDSPTRMTRNNASYSSAAFDRCRRMHLLSGPLSDVGKVDLWGVGQTGKPWLRWLQDCGLEVGRAYDVNERKIGHSIHGVLVMSPMQMPATDGTPLVIAVGADKARALIRQHILPRGYVPGVDAWFVA
ncbi:MAG: glycosyltransferase family 2 protein [Planctomycetota bacterium]|nr:glycosyltransferase family 2 protein [Planctomycetota bacterium]